MRILLILLIFVCSNATAANNEAFEERAKALYKEVLCQQCSGQSISESEAPIAISTRAFIKAEIELGKTDQEIKDELVIAYGPGILTTPPLNASTSLLWLLPVLLLLFGAYVIWRFSRTDEA